MKFLVLLSLIALAATAPAERDKRSPDDDDFYFFVRPGRQTVIPRTRNYFRTSSFRSFGAPRGYYIKLDDDDLYDDRRKRQAVQPHTRQKRSADFDFDDDDYYYFYRRNPVRTISTYTSATAPRTTVAAGPRLYAPQSFIYYDFDDFDDRRKKRSADFDFDDDNDDYFRFVSAPVYRSYSAPIVQSRTSYTPLVYSRSSPITYYYDFDDDK